MMDEDEKAAVLACNEWAREDYRRDLLPAHASKAGFAAGLKHARRWRPLTSDEATRPPTGERVLFSWRTGVVGVGQLATRDMVIWDGHEYPLNNIIDARAWLPLPPPSEEVGGG